MSSCLRNRCVLLSMWLVLCIATITLGQTSQNGAADGAAEVSEVSAGTTGKTLGDRGEELGDRVEGSSDAIADSTPEAAHASVEAILALPPQEAAKQRLIQFEGTVHAYNPVHDSVFLHDGNHDIYVRYHDSRRLTTGQRVRIQGRTLNGITNNLVIASHVEVLQDRVALAEPTLVELANLDQQELDCKWIRIDDLLIESLVSEGEVLTLVGKQHGDSVYVSLYGAIPEAEQAQLIGSTVSVTGNFGLFVVADKVQGAGIFSHPKLITTTRPAEYVMKLMPFTQVGRLRQTVDNQFRTQGIVTYRDEFGLFLQDNSGGTWFDIPHPMPFLAVGSTVGAVGLRQQTPDGNRLSLRQLSVQFITPLPDVDVTPISKLPASAESTRVRLTGTLEAFQYNDTRQLSELILQCGPKRVLVHVPSTDAKLNTMHLQTASELSVAGTITFAALTEQDSKFDMRMFSPSFDDIEVGIRKSELRNLLVQYGLLLSGIVALLCLLWGYRNRLSNVRKGRELDGLSAQLRSSYDSIRDGILIIDHERRIIEANRKAREFFDFDFQVGQTCDDFETELAVKLSADDFLEFWRKRNASHLGTAESVFELKGPQRRILEVFTSPVDTSSDESAARLWAFYDVTERWRLQDSLVHAQKQEAIGRLAGGIAHDFNNFLTGISGNLFVAKLDSTKTVAEVSESLDAAQGAARRAAALVAKLLGFSQKTPLHRREICVNDVVRNMESLLRPSVPSSIQLEFDLQDDLPTVSADAVQLEQVLINICINARDALDQKTGSLNQSDAKSKASPSNPAQTGESSTKVDSSSVGASSSSGEALDDSAAEGLITVRTGTMMIDGVRHVQISIKDNGCGISGDQMSQIFEPFFTTKGSNGTGLGLAMSQGIIQLHGGSISVESQVDEGSEFIVSLPAARAARTECVTQSSDSPMGLQGRHVLIVDDEASIRSLMSRVFSAEKMIVHAVTNGEEAIELLSDRANEIDLVVLDWKMPVRNGKETLPWLKKEFPNVPVIVCSGYVYEAESEFEESTCAPDFYLQKPFRVHDMIQKARSALSNGVLNL